MKQEMASVLYTDAAIFKASGKLDAALTPLKAIFAESKEDVEAMMLNGAIKVVYRVAVRICTKMGNKPKSYKETVCYNQM